MGRGKNLTNNERATVHTLMKKNWSYEQNPFKHKGRSLTLKECEMYGVRLSEQSLKRYAAGMKAQEAFSKWKDNGRMAGHDFSPNRKGRCGRPTLLTDELKDLYRKIIERYAHSWKCLSRRKLRSELRKDGHNLSLGAIQSRLMRMKSRHKAIKAKPMLSAANKKQRAQRCMDRIDKSHGRDRLRFKLDKSSFHVAESWLYVSQTKFKALLIEDMYFDCSQGTT